MAKLYSWLNILIVDDSNTLASYCKKIIQDTYHIENTKVVNSGKECLDALLINKKINMIILDLNMPDMDGVSLIGQLAKINYRGYIIVMSGVSTQIIKGVEQIITKYQLNYLGSLQKPLCLQAIERIFTRLTTNKYSKIHNHAPLKIYEIIRAINNSDIIVHYQPQVNIYSKKVVGVEALCRLLHPSKGIISPDLFIDKAENSDLIYHLTMKVLEISFIDLNHWLSKDIKVIVSVNISPAIFNYNNFYNDLIQLCQQYKIPHELICLEITEGILASNEVLELEVISRLAIQGFSLSLDDFGTGHASIERFFSLPFQQIKIDKSVFTERHINESNLNVIATTSAMAKRSNIEIVIEGIETYEQWNTAKEHGCDIAQGYYVSKPKSADEFLKWRVFWQTHACA